MLGSLKVYKTVQLLPGRYCFNRHRAVRKAHDRIVSFLKEQDGTAVVEYAVMLALIVGIMIAGVSNFGTEVKGLKETTVNALDSSLTPSE